MLMAERQILDEPLINLILNRCKKVRVLEKTFFIIFVFLSKVDFHRHLFCKGRRVLKRNFILQPAPKSMVFLWHQNLVVSVYNKIDRQFFTNL